MAALIYDEEAQAWTEPQSVPQRYDPTEGARVATTGMAYDEESQAWTERWSAKKAKFWAFDQNFADLNPSTTISYPDGFENTLFEPMLTNEGTGTVTAGGWLPFLQDTLKNYPYMVSTSGEADYQIDPDDYTKRIGGAASDYNNTSYSGGAFAWLNKIYIREEYAADGNSRRVIFTDRAEDGFYPMGFVDSNGDELEGVWLPMGYMDSAGRTLVAGTSPAQSLTTDSQKSLIDGFSSRAVFLGGPMLNLLRDLEYMMFKSTDIQLQAGHGRCSGSSSAKLVNNAVVANGNVPGWKGTSDRNTLNKYFHSQVLGSYQQWIRDPYTITINGALYCSPNYVYDLTGANLYNTGKTWFSGEGWIYPATMIDLGGNCGSFPGTDNSGSTSTGLCDGTSGRASGTFVALRLGYSSADLVDGPAFADLYNSASLKAWYIGAGVLLLPKPGYAPEISAQV